MAKSYFQENNIKYTEYDVSVDRQAANEMVEVSGQMGVPVIVIDGEVIIGFNKPRIQQLIAQGGNEHISLGISIADAGRILDKPGTSLRKGAYIGSVKPGSTGDNLKLKTGDIIVKLNTMPVDGAGDIEKAMANFRKGDRLLVTYVRDNTELGSEIIL